MSGYGGGIVGNSAANIGQSYSYFSAAIELDNKMWESALISFYFSSDSLVLFFDWRCV